MKSEKSLPFNTEKNLRLVQAQNYRPADQNDPLEHIYHVLADGSLVGGIASILPAILSSVETNKKTAVVLDSAILRMIPPGQLERLILKDYVALENDWVDLIVIGNNAIIRKIDKIRSFVEARKKAFELSVCSPSSIVSTIEEAAESANAQSMVTVEKLSPGFAVYCCLEGLKLVISELIFNALKFNGGGKINVFFGHEDKFKINIKNIENKDYKTPSEIGLFRKNQKITNVDRFPDDLGIGSGLDTSKQVLNKLGGDLTIRRVADNTGNVLRAAVLAEVTLQYASAESIALLQEDVI